jgi:DNA-binding HxlR family transcriptional regulator
MSKFKPPDQDQLDKIKVLYEKHPPPADGEIDPRLEKLVEDFMGHIADKWTMLVLEALVEHGQVRFTQLGRLVGGISQKMLTQTVRQMERDGLLTRKVFPVIPPRVEYKVTELGLTLSAAFCGVWVWAAENLGAVEKSRREFDRKARDNSQGEDGMA